MHQLQAEIHRVHNNKTLNEKQKSSLIKEKHAALMRPVSLAINFFFELSFLPFLCAVSHIIVYCVGETCPAVKTAISIMFLK